jgi:hypothetical protein
MSDKSMTDIVLVSNTRFPASGGKVEFEDPFMSMI